MEVGAQEDTQITTLPLDPPEPQINLGSGSMELRMEQPVGAVNVRVGLLAQPLEAGTPAALPEEAILLNTQMTRRYDLAQQ